MFRSLSQECPEGSTAYLLATSPAPRPAHTCQGLREERGWGGAAYIWTHRPSRRETRRRGCSERQSRSSLACAARQPHHRACSRTRPSPQGGRWPGATWRTSPGPREVPPGGRASSRFPPGPTWSGCSLADVVLCRPARTPLCGGVGTLSPPLCLAKSLVLSTSRPPRNHLLQCPGRSGGRRDSTARRPGSPSRPSTMRCSRCRRRPR